jgi:antitoxin Phd
MRTWGLQEAKSRFSEIIDLTMVEGPHLVTRRGAEAVVILAAEDYHRLVGEAPNLIDHFLKAPRGDALVITRSKELIRGFKRQTT